MRKWMRERLKRRKTTDPAPAESAPAPLQPAYFDEEAAEASPPTAEYDNVEVGTEVADSTEAEQAGEAGEPANEGAEQPAVEAGGPSGDAAKRSRRRRRGGRGRRGGTRDRSAAQGTAGKEARTGEKQPEAIPAVAAAAAPEQARAPKGVVVLAIGLPGSGKSSWFKRNNIVPLSSDLMRQLLFDDVREQRFQDLVFSNLRSLLKARLIAHRPTNYVDATNLTPQERQHWIKLAHDYSYEVHALFFDVPIEVCIERHQRRDRVVPEDVMRRMAAKFKPPTFEEGFSKVTVVRVKKKEAAAG